MVDRTRPRRGEPPATPTRDGPPPARGGASGPVPPAQSWTSETIQTIPEGAAGTAPQCGKPGDSPAQMQGQQDRFMAENDDSQLSTLGYRTAGSGRRAEIGAARRARSRNTLLTAAFTCFGQETGQASRIEDICKCAGVARGTFYNHFDDLEQLKYQLQEELTGEFDRAVHLMLAALDSPAEQTAVAIRYYLHAAEKNPAWGWAMIHSSAPGHTFGETVWHNSLVTIRRGLDQGVFSISTAEIGRDILMGAVAAAMVSITQGCTPADYPEQIARHILLAFGMSAAEAQQICTRPLPALPAIAHEKIVIASMPALGEIGGPEPPGGGR